MELKESVTDLKIWSTLVASFVSVNSSFNNVNNIDCLRRIGKS